MFWKSQHDDEIFEKYMAELKNLASACGFGELHDSFLIWKIVDNIRSEMSRSETGRKRSTYDTGKNNHHTLSR